MGCCATEKMIVNKSGWQLKDTLTSAGMWQIASSDPPLFLLSGLLCWPAGLSLSRAWITVIMRTIKSMSSSRRGCGHGPVVMPHSDFSSSCALYLINHIKFKGAEFDFRYINLPKCCRPDLFEVDYVPNGNQLGSWVQLLGSYLIEK